MASAPERRLPRAYRTSRKTHAAVNRSPNAYVSATRSPASRSAAASNPAPSTLLETTIPSPIRSSSNLHAQLLTTKLAKHPSSQSIAESHPVRHRWPSPFPRARSANCAALPAKNLSLNSRKKTDLGVGLRYRGAIDMRPFPFVPLDQTLFRHDLQQLQHARIDHRALGIHRLEQLPTVAGPRSQRIPNNSSSPSVGLGISFFFTMRKRQYTRKFVHVNENIRR
jgi:hypothetical protein